MSRKAKILVICDYYLPGFESGEAVRTLANMVDRLGDRFDFRIITRDHDGSAVRTSYTSVKIGEWNKSGNAQVYYLSKDQVRAGALRKLIHETDADAVYLNSFFARLTILYLMLLRLRRIKQKPLIMAPEGEFSPGALSLGSSKKRAYIAGAKALLLSSKFIWKAASESEKSEISDVFGNQFEILVAPNMPPQMIYPDFKHTLKPPKKAGTARMVFLSRFMRKKNFNWLLDKLGPVEGELAFDIWGTLEEPDYWAECQRIADRLPANIRVESKGPISHELVSQTLAEYDFFVLPTLGENFGHVFIEAFASGVPVITSDRTPWRDLAEKGIGWDIPLEDPTAWNRAIQRCVAMDDTAYQSMSGKARSFAVEWLSDPEIERTNIEILNKAVTGWMYGAEPPA